MRLIRLRLVKLRLKWGGGSDNLTPGADSEDPADNNDPEAPADEEIEGGESGVTDTDAGNSEGESPDEDGTDSSVSDGTDEGGNTDSTQDVQDTVTEDGQESGEGSDEGNSNETGQNEQDDPDNSSDGTSQDGINNTTDAVDEIVDGEKGTGIETGSESAEISGASNGGLVGVQQNSNAVLGKVQTTALEIENISDDDYIQSVLADLKEGKNVTLDRPISVDDHVEIIGDNVIFDLGGNELEVKGEKDFIDNKSTLKSKANIYVSGNVTIRNGTINGTVSNRSEKTSEQVIAVVGEDSSLELGDLLVTGTADALVGVYGGELVSEADFDTDTSSLINAYGGKVTINGGMMNGVQGIGAFDRGYNKDSEGSEIIINDVDMTVEAYVVSTNNVLSADSSATINGGCLRSSNKVSAIYWPTTGKLTLGQEGADDSELEIIGATAIEICSGDLVINSGTFTGIGELTDDNNLPALYVQNTGSAGCGDAITIITNRSKPYVDGHPLDVQINGGTFNSENNWAVRYVDGNAGRTNSDDYLEQSVGADIIGGIFTGAEGAIKDYPVDGEYAPLNITGGTFSSDISEYLPDGYQLVPGTDGNYDVMSGEEYIETDLAAAVNKAIEEGKTSLKLNDTLYTFRSDVNIESDFVLDMGEASVQGTGRFVVSGADFTLKNGIYDYTDNNTAVVINSGADVTLEDVKITTHESGNPVMLYGQNPKLTVSGSDTLLSSEEWYVIGTNGSTDPEKGTHGAEIVINDGVIEAGNEGAIYLPGEGGNITINGGQIFGYQGGVQLCSGSLEMNGGLIEVSWDGEPIQVDGIAADGNVYDGAAISFFSREGYYGETETDNSIVIHGGELISRANSPLFIYGGKKSTNGCAISSEIQFLENLTIDGGIFTVSEGDEPAVRILNDDMPEVLAITGGTYSSDINEYVADGFKCVANGSNYIVVDDSLKEDQPTEIAERVTVSIDTNSAVNDAVSGLTAEQAEAARTEAESTVSTFISEVSGNAAVNEFAGTGLAAAIDTANIPSSKVSNPNLAEVFVKTELNDVELETNVNSDGTVSVNISKLVFDITPFIKEPGKDAVEIENEWLNGRGITVRLPIPASRASERSYVTVKHIADDGSDRTYYPSVREENGNYYCELTVMHFSTFEMTFNARPASSDSSGSRNESNRNSVSKGTIYADGTTSGIMNHSTGTWKQNETGWWFERTDGSYPANTWEKLSWNGRENWYHFNAAGYLDAGWFTDTDGSTYYLHNTHDNNFGYMYTGWNMINGNYYYFFNETDGGHKEGSMARGMVTPDGYTVNEDGIWTE